ncbi:MAG: hypothetical protein Q8M58_03975, partial [Anaerolineales bacterium]|nr:hypothetical protein [Anaerolineales bacterium]
KALNTVIRHSDGKGKSPNKAIAARACSEPSSANKILNRCLFLGVIMSYLLSFVSGQPFNSPTYTLPQWRMNFYSWFSDFHGFASSGLPVGLRQVFVTE